MLHGPSDPEDLWNSSGSGTVGFGFVIVMVKCSYLSRYSRAVHSKTVN